MFLPRLVTLVVMTLLMGVLLCCPSAQSDIIDEADIYEISGSLVGSGNGTLDLRLFTFSGSEIDNSAGGFNGDNANNTLPQGGGADTNSFDESYLTTAGELQQFYILNFPDGAGGSTASQLALFLDLNETGPTSRANNSLTRFDVVINPTSVQGGPDPSLDLTGAQQAAINQTYAGGGLGAQLFSAINLPVVQQGAGFADYAILTGIDVFSLNASDQVLFNISMSTLNDGAEEFFLSGEFSASDVIPEPSTGVLGWVLLAGLVLRRRPRKNV